MQTQIAAPYSMSPQRLHTAVPYRAGAGAVQGHAFPARSCGIPGMRELGAQREPHCAAKLSQAAPRRKKTFLSPSSGRYAKCGMTCAAQRIHPTVPARRKLA